MCSSCRCGNKKNTNCQHTKRITSRLEILEAPRQLVYMPRRDVLPHRSTFHEKFGDAIIAFNLYQHEESCPRKVLERQKRIVLKPYDGHICVPIYKEKKRLENVGCYFDKYNLEKKKRDLAIFYEDKKYCRYKTMKDLKKVDVEPGAAIYRTKDRQTICQKAFQYAFQCEQELQKLGHSTGTNGVQINECQKKIRGIVEILQAYRC